MTKHSGKWIVAMALTFLAGSAGAFTVPFDGSSFQWAGMSVMPEPSATLLLGMGLAAGLVRRLRPADVKK